MNFCLLSSSVFYGQLEKKHVVDLIIVDYLDGLGVLGVWDPPSQIPCWNANIPSFLHILMMFALTYLHDDETFIIFYLDSFAVKREVAGFFKNYKLKIKDEWTIINCLHLANPMNPSKNINNNMAFHLDCFIFQFVFIWCVFFNFNIFLLLDYEIFH